MTLIKTSILTFIATLARLCSGLVINKAVAIFIGPNGLALIGHFQNFIQLAMIFAQGAINTGVTKYTAEYGRESENLPQLFGTAVKISATCSVSVGLLMVFLSRFASRKFFDSDEYGYVFVVFGFTIILFVFNSLLLSILNGLKEIRIFISANIIQSVFGLFYTATLIYFFTLDGVLVALVTNQSVVFIALLFYISKKNIVCWASFKGGFDCQTGKKLSKYALMAVVSGVCTPVSHMLVRDYIGEEVGWDEAGYWQAVWYISTMYLMVVTTALSTYYLPRLSEIKDKLELRNELIAGYRIIFPIVVLLAFSIFLLKDLIIYLLFTDEFNPMRELFLWQLVGDVLKISSWLVAYLLIARAKTKMYVISEVLFSVSFVALSCVCVSLFGLIGVTYAFAVNYLLYFVAVSLLVRNEIF